MIIAGLTGGIGHGKTTFANLLANECKASRHFESWELVAEVATALKEQGIDHPAPDVIATVNQWLFPLADIVAFHMHVRVAFNDIKLDQERLNAHPEHYEKLFEYLTLVQANSELAHMPITSQTKESFRTLLQWLGGYLVATVGSGVWYDELLRRIAHLNATGIELVTVGGVRYPADAERMRNAGAVILEIRRSDTPSQDARDLTERERDLIDADSVILNNGTLEQLATCAGVIFDDLRLRQLQANYLASSTAKQPS